MSLVTLLFFSATALAATTDYGRLTEQLSSAVKQCRDLAAQAAPYDVVFRRDPMKPLVDAQGQLVSSSGMHGGLSVDGIIWSEENPLAIIDDELVPPGTIIGPYTVMQIHSDGIVVKTREGDIVFVPLDRGLEPQQAQPSSPSAS